MHCAGYAHGHTHARARGTHIKRQFVRIAQNALAATCTRREHCGISIVHNTICGYSIFIRVGYSDKTRYIIRTVKKRKKKTAMNINRVVPVRLMLLLRKLVYYARVLYERCIRYIVRRPQLFFGQLHVYTLVYCIIMYIIL